MTTDLKASRAGAVVGTIQADRPWSKRLCRRMSEPKQIGLSGAKHPRPHSSSLEAASQGS